MQTYQSPENFVTRIYHLFTHKKILYPAGLSAAVLLLAITITSRQYLPENAPGILALQFCPTPAKFTEIIQQWGEGGLSGYRAAMRLDYLFPAAYGLFFASLISRLDYGRTGISPFFFFPLAAALFDWLENSIHLLITRDPGAISTGLVTFSFIITISKWLLLLAVVLYILVRAGSLLRLGNRIP